MTEVEIVTGFTPIPGHPRSSRWYHEQGQRLSLAAIRAGIVPFRLIENELKDCWLHRYMVAHGINPVPAIDDNPAKNTVAYHVVQHQKFASLAAAATLSRADTLIWVDYGIFGAVPGITDEIVARFLSRIKPDDFAIPGCWSQAAISDVVPSWRFCGGVMVVPRSQAIELYGAVRDEVTAHVVRTGRLSWEVNTLARCEQNGTISPRWYQADHNERMFTGY